MKKIAKHLNLLMIALIFTGFAAVAQSSIIPIGEKNANGKVMKTFVIERNIPGAGQFTPEKLKGISEKSCSVLTEMGPEIKWLHSYVTDDKIICVYQAENIDLVREHATKGGFPANAIYEVYSVISPATAKQ